MPEKTEKKQSSFDHNQDRFPTLERVFQRIMQEEDVPKTGVLRVEIGCQANGEATYRVTARDAVEDIGGFLPAEDSS